jgi:predicted DNA-binding transcriptional regulator YafY
VPRGGQVHRQWQTLLMLQRRGYGLTLAELAAEFGLSQRTIQRDLEVLQELGVPVDYETDERGKRYWRLPNDYFRQGPLALSLTEAISLQFAQHLLAPLAGTLFAVGLAELSRKIRRLIPARALEHFRALDQTVHVRHAAHTDYTAHAGHIEALTGAARDSRTVRIRYRALWRRAEYTTAFDPYGLVYHDGDLFVIGRSHQARALRILKVARVLDVTETRDSFTRPAGFSLEDHFRNTFGIVQTGGRPVEIVVRFTGPMAALVEERTWHVSQQVRWLPADSTLFEDQRGEPAALEATFRLADVVEFKRWLRGFGEHAVVRRPAWLRRELRDELAAALRRYDADVS